MTSIHSNFYYFCLVWFQVLRSLLFWLYYNMLIVLNLTEEKILSIISIIPFLLLYIIYDLMKNDYFEEPLEHKNPYLQDLYGTLQLYLVKNTIKKMSMRAGIDFLFKILYGIITPITMVNFPKLKYDILFYIGQRKSLIISRAWWTRRGKYLFCRKTGWSLAYSKRSDLVKMWKYICIIRKELNRGVSIYLWPDYSGKDAETKWGLFSIFKRENEKAKKCGYFFIHCFNTPKRKKYWKKGFRWHMPVSTNAIILFSLVSEVS